MFKCESVQVAVWVAMAVLEYGAVENADDLYFRQIEVTRKAQSYSDSKVASARISQWFNGDHGNNTYNFLKSTGSKRRLTGMGEFNGIKEMPEKLNEYFDEEVILNNGDSISIKTLHKWVIEVYSKIVNDLYPIVKNQIVDIKEIVEQKSLVVSNALAIESTKRELELKKPTIYGSSIYNLLKQFMSSFQFMEIEVYNEFSLQHELGLYLRNNLPKKYKVQFERNVSYFNLVKSEFTKKEIDIVVYSLDKSEKYAIELKAPRNGEVPEQMFSMVKDIKFLEQLRESGFDGCYQLTHVENHLFATGPNMVNKGIYEYFRNGKTIHGFIEKPTGSDKGQIQIKGEYQIDWDEMDNHEWYFVIDI